MRVVFSDAAKVDLIAIGDHIAKDNPSRGLAFLRLLRAKALQLGDMPEVFPLVPRYARHGIRRRVYRDYLLFYRVENSQVVIIHILHGARDYEAVLLPEA